MIGEVLDQIDMVSPKPTCSKYRLPGIDRVLKKEKDFMRFKDSKARITVFAPIDGQRNFLGPDRVCGRGEGNDRRTSPAKQ